MINFFKMQVVKITIESDEGRYKFYIDSVDLLSVLQNNLFTRAIISPQNGKMVIHGEEIKKALKITEDKKEA